MVDAVPRPLTDRERGVLEAVVARTGRLAPHLASQLKTVRVVGTCGCGCPSVFFGHEDNDAGIEKVADVAVRNTNDAILLYVSANGYLDSLDYMWIGDEIPAGFPPPHDFGADNA